MKALEHTLFGIGVLLLVGLTAIGTAALKARTFDGPTQLFAGGPLVSGPWVSEAEPDWRFTEEIESIELQLLEPPTSRRTWILYSDGRIYVVSGNHDTWLGRLWFTWPFDAEADGRAVVRIDGTRYPRQLRRIRSGEILDGVTAALREKYDMSGTRQDVESGSFWVFELAPRIASTP